ncbi:MAG: hypothetical protein HQK52_21470 [Oligoflexia bacterium]|nr:hypothetical protein [Oligoflexia bacterium]
MKKALLVGFFFMSFLLCAFDLFAIDSAKDKLDKWQALYDSVVNDIKLIEMRKSKDAELYLRLLELYAEKIQLLARQYNEHLIYYKSSEIKTVKQKIEKNIEVNFKRLSEIKIFLFQLKIDEIKRFKTHYILFQTYEALKRYKQSYSEMKLAESTGENIIRGASKSANSDNFLVPLSRVYLKLAEYHYNEQQIDFAMLYYKKIIGNKNDKWLPKYYYNYAWCLLKKKDSEAAFSSLMTALKLNRDPKYVRIEEQILTNFALFSVTALKTKRGLDLLKKLQQNNFSNLMSFLQAASEYGSQNDLSAVFAELDLLEKDPKQQNEFLLTKLSICKKHKLIADFERTLQELRKRFQEKKIALDERTTAIEDIKEFTSFLQSRVKVMDSMDQKKLLMKYALFNLDTLGVFDPENRSIYYYHKGEIASDASENYYALESYYQAISCCPVTSANRSNYRNSMNAFFESIEKNKITDQKKEKMLYNAFDLFLKHFPNDNSTKEIYQKKFNLCLNQEKKDYIAAEKTLDDYAKVIPQDRNVQRKMFELLSNTYAKAIDRKGLRRQQQKIANGFLGFGNRELSQLKNILSATSLSSIAKIEQSGDYKKAMELYAATFEDEKKIIGEKGENRELALSIAMKNVVLAQKIGDRPQMILWAQKAVEISYEQDMENNLKLFLFVIEQSYLNDEIEQAIFFVERMVDRCNSNKTVCSNDLKKQIFEKNISLLLSVAKGVKKAALLLAEAVQNKMINVELLKIYYVNALESVMLEQNNDLFYMLLTLPFEKNWPLDVKNYALDVIKIVYWKNYGLARSKLIDDLLVFFQKRPQEAGNLLYLHERLEKGMNFAIGKFHEGAITFEIFKGLLQNKILEIKDTTTRIEAGMEGMPRCFVLVLLKKAVAYLVENMAYLKQYMPKTADKVLLEAIEKEIDNILKILELKQKEYMQIADKLAYSSGGHCSQGYELFVSEKNRSFVISPMKLDHYLKTMPIPVGASQSKTKE